MDGNFKRSVNIGLFQLRNQSGVNSEKHHMAFVVRADAPGTTAKSVLVNQVPRPETQPATRSSSARPN
jgi:hypothetical protein